MARRVTTVKDRAFSIVCFIVIFFCILMIVMIVLSLLSIFIFLKAP